MEERKTSRYFSSGNASSGNDRSNPSQNETGLVEDPMDILLSTEYKGASSSQVSHLANGSDSDDWEDLQDPSKDIKRNASQISVTFNPQKLPAQLQMEQEVQRQMKLMLTRLRKMQSSQILKAYSLSFLAHGIFLSIKCDDPVSKGIALSLLPSEIGVDRPASSRRKNKLFSRPLTTIHDVLRWYRNNITLTVGVDEKQSPEIILTEKKASSRTSYIQGVVLVFRALSIPSRIVMHLWPRILKMKSQKVAVTDFDSGETSKTVVPSGQPNSKKRQQPSSSKEESKKRATSKPSPYFASGSGSTEDLDTKIFPFGVSQSNYFNLWLEVYDSDAKKWLVVDPVSLEVCNGEWIEAFLKFSYSVPNVEQSKVSIVVAFVVAFDEGSTASDVTPRYASATLHTSTRRERGDAEHEAWWKETLDLLKPSGQIFECEQSVLSQSASAEKHPVPLRIAQLRSHPLYVLARHIHKYEAIYPPDTKPIAHVKNEPVFNRACLHVLHNREKWLLEGRQIKAGEEPYKTVTGNRKPAKKGEKERQPAKMVGFFGHWQTEDYVPPSIVDGKVPRNAYDNIELFKPWMLPPGTCHITLEGIKATARRLNIDFVPAMVGWDFHGGVNHPVIDGIVVLEDVREVLECAWRQEKHIEIEETLVNKSNKSISNWKRLVKALLLKQRLEDRYLPS